MTLLTESSPSTSVGLQGGKTPVPTALEFSVASLETRVDFMRYCEHCGEETQFNAGWFSLAGLIGVCLQCGTPDVAEYTRENSEVA
jgi:hypothetical protein